MENWEKTNRTMNLTSSIIDLTMRKVWEYCFLMIKRMRITLSFKTTLKQITASFFSIFFTKNYFSFPFIILFDSHRQIWLPYNLVFTFLGIVFKIQLFNLSFVLNITNLSNWMKKDFLSFPLNTLLYTFRFCKMFFFLSYNSGINII